MNSYRELFTVNVADDEVYGSYTLYECGECGVTVTEIPVHEQFHVKVDAMWNYLNYKPTVKLTHNEAETLEKLSPGIFERLGKMDLSPEAQAWVDKMKEEGR